MLEVKRLKKAFAGESGSVKAVRDVSFSVDSGEIYTLLGPSGCGKTTTLRCVAGLESPDDGSIELDGAPVFEADQQINISPNRRNVGMVFQSYAIWPHLSVFDNVAYPLKFGSHRASRKEIAQKVQRALSLVQLEAMANRPAPLLSGGQQQRVALARALVYEPKILLLDEPLSNLDAKLRVEMREEIQSLIKRLGITVLYVTHDQEEALAISDRISVMQNGVILQEGSPEDIFARPIDPFVASFVGGTNLMSGTVREAVSGQCLTADTEFGELVCSWAPGYETLTAGSSVWLLLRPEHMELHAGVGTASCREPNTFEATIIRGTYLGVRSRIQLQIGTTICQGEIEGNYSTASGTPILAKIPREHLRVLYKGDEQGG